MIDAFNRFFDFEIFAISATFFLLIAMLIRLIFKKAKNKKIAERVLEKGTTMRERLAELLMYATENTTTWGYDSFFEMAEYLLANGVVVSPVKLGQTVWCIGTKCRSGLYDMPCKRAVSSECFDCPLLTELCVFEREVNNWSWFYLTLEKGEDLAWGETVFATKEEAERALAERNGSHDP